MKTFIVHHTPRRAGQDNWAVAFSLPYIATEYARVNDGLWYVKTWLGAEQIKKRLAILFDTPEELSVHELGRTDDAVAQRLKWMQGRLEDEQPIESWPLPRGVWSAVQSAIHAVTPRDRNLS